MQGSMEQACVNSPTSRLDAVEKRFQSVQAHLDIHEGLRLQRELEHFSQLNSMEHTLSTTNRIYELVEDEEKNSLRETLIENHFIASVCEALVRLWPSQRQENTDEIEVFEHMSALLVLFCQKNERYAKRNRQKLANDGARVIIAGLVLPTEQASSFEFTWEHIFQYMDARVLQKTVSHVCSSRLDERIFDVLVEKIDQKRIGIGSYSWLDYHKNMLMAPIGLLFDLIQFPGFINKEEYLSVAILLAANTITGLAAGFLCSDIDMDVVPGCLQWALGSSRRVGEIVYQVHNFFTFGVSGLMMQIQKAYDRMSKNDEIVRMDRFLAMKASVNLIITGMSLLDNPWHGTSLLEKTLYGFKWASSLYSVYRISDTAFKVHKSVLYDYRHYLKHKTPQSNMVRKFIRLPRGSLFLYGFHVSEVLGIFVYLLAEKLLPYSLLSIVMSELVVLAAGIFWYTKGKDEEGVGHDHWKLSFYAPTYLWSNPLLGANSDRISFNLFVVFVRPVPWLVAWGLVLAGASPRIPEHEQLTARIYCIMASVGLLMYATTATFFYKLGLWHRNEDANGA